MAARKKNTGPKHYCWDCVFSELNMDERYRTPDGNPIFKNCTNPEKRRRGIMDNTPACGLYKQ